MPSDDISISARNLTKTYRIFGHPSDRIKQAMTFGLRKYHREFTAIKDVSFNIRKGEIVGVVGVNGSGKSTLLQLVCGILKPTTGSISVNGRVSALLELGAGFNPEFTGRENVYFQGALMGLTKVQMDQRFDDIAAFANIGEFIDQPVRMYSSGMYVRLAFTVAVNVDPEILVVDEALAVGDAGFRSRCFRRIGELRKAGCTIFFVSHSIEEIVRICGKAMLLDEGELLLAGQPDQVVKQYQCILGAGSDTRRAIRRRFRGIQVSGLQAKGIDGIPEGEEGSIGNTEVYDLESGSGNALAYEPNGALIESVRIVDATGQRIDQLRTGVTYRCIYRVNFTQDASHVRCAILIKTPEGVDLGGGMSAPTMENGIPSVSQGSAVDVEFEFSCILNPGNYLLSVAVFGSEAGVEYALHGIRGALTFRVTRNSNCSTLGAVDLSCRSTVRMLTSDVVE
ncbi:MAG: ABC transporter ATP-binding protein [Candidatus Sedimenticola sp. (ex Thyasira tokunagai)]